MNKDLVTISIYGWKTRVSGVIIAESSEWIILNINPVDYVLDGFVMIFRKYIENIEVSKANIFKYNVIKSCDKIRYTKLNFTKENNKSTIIKKIGNLYEIISIGESLDDEVFIGMFEKIRNGKILLRSVKTNGKFGNVDSFDCDSIRVIEFDTDYLYSLGCYIKATM